MEILIQSRKINEEMGLTWIKNKVQHDKRRKIKTLYRVSKSLFAASWNWWINLNKFVSLEKLIKIGVFLALGEQTILYKQEKQTVFQSLICPRS